MSRVSWQNVKHRFDPENHGRFVLLLGPAKMGKTTVVSQLYRYLETDRIFWISAGELDGWRSVIKAVGIEPEGVDVDELGSLRAFWQVLESLRDGWHQAIVLDSFDGAARWAERHICNADQRRRLDKSTGIQKLDQRGYGLKLNWSIATVRDYLYPLTNNGTHVIVTCGLKSLDMGGDSMLVPDIEGQSALVVPRYFGDVAVIRRGRKERMVCFEGPEHLSVYGSRSGFPAETPATEFIAELLRSGQKQFHFNAVQKTNGAATHDSGQSQGEQSSDSASTNSGSDNSGSISSASNLRRSESDLDRESERPWWEHEFPELQPSYRLRETDFMAGDSGCVGMPMGVADAWIKRVRTEGRKLKRARKISSLERRQLALICWAHQLESILDNHVAT